MPRRQHNQARGNYPQTAAEVLDDSIKYKREAIAAVKAFARRRPWKGSLRRRREKFGDLHLELCRVYGLRTRLEFVGGAGGSGSSSYSPREDVITLRGRLSVVTYLHEFAHALCGSCERQACRWSLNLFRKCFPRSFARCEVVGHTLVRRGEDAAPVPRVERRRVPRQIARGPVSLGDAIAHLLNEDTARRRRRRVRPECPDDTGRGC